MAETFNNTPGSSDLSLKDRVKDALEARLTFIDDEMQHPSRSHERKAAIEVAVFSADLALNPYQPYRQDQLQRAELQLEYYEAIPTQPDNPPSHDQLDRG